MSSGATIMHICLTTHTDKRSARRRVEHGSAGIGRGQIYLYGHSMITIDQTLRVTTFHSVSHLFTRLARRTL